MLSLPENFKTMIINRYSEKGSQWLGNLDNLIHTYEKQFELESLELVENLSMNLVMFAKSNLYGDVVLKIGAPGPSVITEIHVMQQYPSDYVPKCYYFCLENRTLLLERLLPGYPLNSLPNREERTQVFSNLANQLLLPAKSTEVYPTFCELFQKRIQYANQNKASFSDILWMIDRADKLYHTIQAKNLPQYILHEDLHHKNILKTRTGWKAIDPHGIIGEKVFETCQFIRSEIKIDALEKDKIDKIVTAVSYYFNEDKRLILEALFIYNINKIIFHTKNNFDSSIISFNIEVCKLLLEFFKHKLTLI